MARNRRLQMGVHSEYNENGKVDRYKARLVAKGFTQTYGIDFNETFAPVAKLNTVIIILSLAANLEWELHQLDIKNVFLNGELEEEVYMIQPPTFRIRTRNQLGDGVAEIRDMKRLLAKEFEVKNLDMLKYFLRMEIARNKQGISVSQSKYTLDLLKETGMLGYKASSTPVEPDNKDRMLQGEPVDRTMYPKLVGKLIYLSHTRLDIAFAVSLVSQYMHNPRQGHLDDVLEF
ncbi:transmembrane signal receptor [Lithospermum erythrorhizon]|uniref:Transmembrane signal receptor n=1 Tax=Lithospermum erythrorhizon TaxID=34254 RepID=A0AAV3NIE4_LITER